MDKAKPDEAQKAFQHLALLREQYVKLQEKYVTLEQKLVLVNSPISDNDSFLSSLMKFVGSLYNKEAYSDITINLVEGLFPGHKFVFAVRGNNWGVKELSQTTSLDLTHLGEDVGPALLKWLYTDHILLTDHDLAMKLIKAAAKFNLSSLMKRCEEALIGLVHVKNCVQLYSTAEEIGATSLMNHCSSLISTHWDDFTSDDFSHMTAPLLYEMFKTKTKYLLHSAVRLHREDVLFLFLIDHDSQLPNILDKSDDSGRLALDLALEAGQTSIAKTLIKHKASVDALDPEGDSLIHCALVRGDSSAASFLIDEGCCLSVLDKSMLRSPLHIIASCKYPSNNVELEMVQVAGRIASKVDINIQDSELKTSLHLAIENNKREIVELLINQKSIQLDVRDEYDMPPLLYALLQQDDSFNSYCTSALLVSKGASVDLKFRETGDSLLHLLIKENKEFASLFLIENGASLSDTNKHGETALHLSCTYAMTSVTKALLKGGCNPNLLTIPSSPQMNGLNGTPFDDLDQKLYRESPLHRAVRSNCYNDVLAMLEHYDNCVSNKGLKLIKPNLDMEDCESLTPLGAALVAGRIEMATLLQQKGANVDQLSPEGLSLLHRSILLDNSEMATFLLSYKADPNLRTREGASSLQLSVEHSLASVVESLCEKGAFISATSPSNTDPPIWLALTRGEFEIASILVRYNADVDFWSEGPSGCHQTLLHRAIDENLEDIACFLVRSGCSVNVVRRESPGGMGGDIATENQTPLHLCCSWGLLEACKEILSFGAKVNAKDYESKTPFHIALENGHQDIIFLLLKQASLDLGAKDHRGKTPFSIAMQNKNNKAAQAILDRYSAAAEQYDNKGQTFLHAAVQKVDLESVLFLLGIHVNLTCRTKDDRSMTPLLLATLQGNEMIVRNLLLAGANVNELTPQKETCLHLAAKEDHYHLVTIFLENGINVDALDANFNNALHVSVKEANLSSVRTLLNESQINAGAMNLRGQNALHILAAYPKNNAAAIAELFLQALPDYPINNTEVEGNTALFLAYMKGAGQLCRVLVRAGACLGTANKHGVHMFNFEVPSKTLLGRLLDGLSVEPPWSEGDFCLECGCRFGLATRRHHCRHCGRVLCAKCSCKDVPIIKFHINKPVRVCQTCFDVITLGAGAFS